MDELLKVSYESDEPRISARELYKNLGISKRFSAWFESNSQGFAEKEDYTSVLISTEVQNNGGIQKRELQDYSLTVDMAKHICLMSRTEKGKQCRQYLIDLEKAWNTPEQVMARALKIADKQIEELKENNHLLEQKIEQDRPKTIFADAVSASETSILVGDLAKLICQNGYQIGQKRLFEWLRQNGYLMKCGSSRNMPTQRVKKGLWMGGGRIPYGYYYDRNDGILHIDEENAIKVRKAYELYLKGFSCQKISDVLGMSGDTIVHRALTNKVYLGYIFYKDKLYKGLHEPIIDQKTYDDVQRFMKKRSTNSFVGNKYMLSGLCYCGKCGARMRYKKWSQRYIMECYSRDGGKPYMVRDSKCDNRRINVEIIEQEVSDCFRRFIVNAKASERKESKKVATEKEIKKTTYKLKKLYNLYVDSESETLFSIIQQEEKKRKLLEKELEEAIREESSDTNVKIEEIKRISNIWDDLTTKEQNRILKECVEKIVITDGNIDIHFRII